MTILAEDVTQREDPKRAELEDVTPDRIISHELAASHTDSHELAPMTDDEYERFVHSWIGIPYQLNGEDPATGLDCRTLAVKFLRAQGVGIRDTDDQPLPATIEDLDIARYEAAVKAAGASVELAELRRNDLVYYRNRKGEVHIGVWLGYDRILTTGQPYGSFIYRIKRHHLAGAVRGREGILLDESQRVAAPPAHPPVVAILAAIGTAVTLGAVTGTAAVIVGAVVVGATIYAVSTGIGALSSGRKAFDFDGSASAGLDASPRYAFDGAKNIRSNQNPVPIIYGSTGLRILNTFEIWNSGSGGQTQKRLVVLGEGELGSIADVQLNGSPIGDFPGCSVTTYVGTATQGVDSRAAGTNVVGLKNTAYLALTLAASEKLSGDPIITCKVTGRLIKTWNGSVFTGAAASGNPAAIIRDYLTLTRERGGCGFPESVIDDASFGAVYDTCEVAVSNGSGGTEPRARLDMIIDSFRPWLDNLQDMMATFGGFLVTDGRKFYLKVEKSESAVQAFTQDTVRDMEYWTFSKDDRPNRIIGVYIDPSAEGNDARTRVSVDDLTDQNKNPRGIVPREVNLLGLSRQSQAIREVTKLLNDVRANWYAVAFTARMEAIALEAGDPFTLVHPVLGDGVTAYSFRALRIEEQPSHERRIIGKAYTASVFNDEFEQQTVTLGYTPPPNPFTPVADVTGLTLTAQGFIQVEDGVFMSNLLATWIEPVDKINLDRYSIEVSEAGGAFLEKAVAFPGATQGIVYTVKVGTAYQVKVKTVNKYDVRSTGATSGSVTPTGDNTVPLDVAGFDASQVGDEIVLTWNANADADIWGYEIREGGTGWASAALVDTVVAGSRYTIRNFAGGTKTYRIKAIDASGNYSLNAASDSLVATDPSDSNILFRYDFFSRSLGGGTFSADAEASPTNEFNPAYHRNTVSLKTIKTLENNTDSWETLQTTLNWDTEERVLTAQTYTSEVIDVGSIQTGITSISHKEFVPDGSVTLQWAFSTTDTNPSTFQTFTEGVYTWRYAKIRVTITTNTTANSVRVYELNLVLDVKDLIDKGTNVAVAAGGSTITFNKTFTQAPAVGITTLDNPYTAYITAKSATSFTVKLRNQTTGLDVAGNIDWIAKGF